MKKTILYLTCFVVLVIILLTISIAQSQKEIDNWIKDTKDGDIFVRVRAVGALAYVTTAPAIQALVRSMQEDEEFYVREKAAKSLMIIGIPCVEQVIPVLKNPNMEIRSLAVWVLKDCTDQKFGTDIKKWENWLKSYKKKVELQAKKKK